MSNFEVHRLEVNASHTPRNLVLVAGDERLSPVLARLELPVERSVVRSIIDVGLLLSFVHRADDAIVILKNLKAHAVKQA